MSNSKASTLGSSGVLYINPGSSRDPVLSQKIMQQLAASNVERASVQASTQLGTSPTVSVQQVTSPSMSTAKQVSFLV